MTATVRLPVVPRPFRDELLSSWMVRVAGRYGLDVQGLTAYLAGQGDSPTALRKIDDADPNPDLLRLWARGCRIDPARLWRLSLKSRHPVRPLEWFMNRAGEAVPACLACFDADFAARRDGYMRGDWRLAECVVCPVHRDMLRDRCPECCAHLRVSFRMRSGRLRPFCSKCEGLLTDRRWKPAARSDADFAGRALALQKQAGTLVRSNPDQRLRLEDAIFTLWAPLDRAGAARPVLALWFDQPGWHCPFEARAAVGTHAPLQKLPVGWRALTLVVLHDLFGAGLISDGPMPEAACRLFRRAASLPYLSQARATEIRKGKAAAERGRRGVQRLSKSPVHRSNGDFAGERADFNRIRP